MTHNKQISKPVLISFFIVLCIYLTGCNHSYSIAESKIGVTIIESSNDTEYENDSTVYQKDNMIVQVEWALNTRWDADFPDLDYADEEKVIFHGDYGLFVYDLVNSKISSSLNLEEIGCQKIQNDGASTIRVSKDGNIVWILPHNKGYTYVFNIAEGIVTKEDRFLPTDYFKNIVDSKEALASQDVKLHLCSKQSVLFDDGDIGYIDYGLGGEFESLTYKKATKSWQLFSPDDI